MPRQRGGAPEAGGGTRTGSRKPSGSSGARGRQPSDGSPPSKPLPGGENRATEAAAGEALEPGLYVVATPIGNAGDITLRALETLRRADLVVCEDTRVTGKLLTIHGVATRRLAYHDHNADRVRPALLARLRRGERIALVSDAGTPLVSDPGYKLVRAAIEEALPVTALPGPSAALAALVLAGLPSDRFMFAGFLPPKKTARLAELAGLAAVPATLVFFESARRLADTLADMGEALGDRPASVARELTKLFEEVRRGRLPELAAHYEEAGPPRGEVVIVVGPPAPQVASPVSLDEQLRAALGRMTVRDASDTVAAATGRKRREVYARALELIAEREDR
jgi:16S rRNA (cytidine1402-2'-O)-methyltransferase